MAALALATPVDGLITGVVPFVALLHGEQTGTMTVWKQPTKANKGKGSWTKLSPDADHAEVNAFLIAQEGQYDRFITVNEFRGWHKGARALKSLRACFVDIDPPDITLPDGSKGKGFVDLDTVLERVADAQLPMPSFVVFSGRGLHLYWLLEPTHAAYRATWDRMQEVLGDALGGDPKARNVARVLRLCGSINSKTKSEDGKGKPVDGRELSMNRWSIDELAMEVLGEVPELTLTEKLVYELPLDEAEEAAWQQRLADGLRLDLEAQAKAQAVKVRSIEHARALSKRDCHKPRGGHIGGWWATVLKDLEAVGEWYRPRGGIPAESRDLWLLLYTVAASWTTKQPELLEGIALTAARRYTCWSDSEVKRNMATAIERAFRAAAGEKDIWVNDNGVALERDPRYAYKRETLIEMLQEILPAGLELKALVPKGVLMERRAKRSLARSADHYVDGARLSSHLVREQALELRAAGRSVREIATEIGAKVATVGRWIKAAVPVANEVLPTPILNDCLTNVPYIAAPRCAAPDCGIPECPKEPECFGLEPVAAPDVLDASELVDVIELMEATEPTPEDCAELAALHSRLRVRAPVKCAPRRADLFLPPVSASAAPAKLAGGSMAPPEAPLEAVDALACLDEPYAPGALASQVLVAMRQAPVPAERQRPRMRIRTAAMRRGDAGVRPGAVDALAVLDEFIA